MPSDHDASTAGDAGWRRLHPLTLLFAIGSRLYGLRGLVLPAGLAVVVSQRRRSHGGWPDVEGWLLAPAALLLLFELVQYFTLAYRFDRHEIVIKRGLIWKRVRHIPYARVQNIELVQHAAHRLAGVAVVRLDTGTGAGAEGELSVLSLDAVAELREAVRLGRRDETAATAAPGDTDVAPPPGVLASLDLRELLLHGLLTSSGWVVIAAAMGALWQIDLDAWGLRRFLPSSAGVLGGLRQATSTLAVELALVVVGATLLFRVLSAVWSAIKHFEFSLTARGEELFQSYGLLTRVGRTIPRPRIQKLTVSEAPLMRLFGRASITVDTAASVAERHSQQARGRQPRARADRAGDAGRDAGARRLPTAHRVSPARRARSRQTRGRQAELAGRRSARLDAAAACAAGAGRDRDWRECADGALVGARHRARRRRGRSRCRPGSRRASPRSPGRATTLVFRSGDGWTRHISLVRAGPRAGRPPRAVAARPPLGHGAASTSTPPAPRAAATTSTSAGCRPPSPTRSTPGSVTRRRR